jgi:hypothetical protein
VDHFSAERFPRVATLLLGSVLWIGASVAAPPPETSALDFTTTNTMVWNPTSGADFYQVYRGTLSGLASGVPARCHGFQVQATTFQTLPEPGSNGGFFYLVTAESTADGEGTPGVDSNLRLRPLLGTCGAVMSAHMLNRLGYGWNEWTRDRLETMGFDAYIADQLVPHLIDESDNLELNDRLGPIDPPVTIVPLIQHQVLRATYSRRQLEQQVATFWANHFNTDWSKVANLYQGVFPQCPPPPAEPPPACDENYPARAHLEATRGVYGEMQNFRRIAFNGSFREILEASALSPAMIIYLDTIYSVAGNPNENYPRELMELHTMEVNGGYTQQDVQELSRVITGWGLCKKAPEDVLDPTAPCIMEYWDDDVPGTIVATFSVGQHDCTEKVLFAGTPEEVTIAATCGNPIDGVDDLFLALDAIVAHPSTARFISTKILQRFVTDEPSEAMIDEMVAVWNDSSNPAGVGDLQALHEAAVTSDAFLDPNRTRSKIKTPLEHFTSTFRATRGATDGATEVINFLEATQHLPHFNPVPTGWPEDGESWIGTNNMLERQNFGIALMPNAGIFFGSDITGLLQDNGIATLPGNAPAIIRFMSDVLFGGALTPAERQQALDYLNTDDLGNPSPYNDLRIRDVVALMLGYPHFQEQ